MRKDNVIQFVKKPKYLKHLTEKDVAEFASTLDIKKIQKIGYSTNPQTIENIKMVECDEESITFKDTKHKHVFYFENFRCFIKPRSLLGMEYCFEMPFINFITELLSKKDAKLAKEYANSATRALISGI